MDELSIQNALQQLEGGEKTLVELFCHGSLTVEFYKPKDVDLQEPHSRDEIYVIASGSGIFRRADAVKNFQAGDVLFVPAGVEHRFEDFSDDFATWVFFYGEEGGEAAVKTGDQ